ncbi:hypothetical protein TraAM80_03419 [Trypanosoma rangeli]|uniref:Uncharacterized protein n=1 Tax=Trypanosoma rangeli TaxID=5698 RepID=A0A422NPM6_TRYRA|nr:uncharacterized protein TraAM80_03419 [Trypanosoma rangeli]RNF07443.1 hypothetical protein TraAM80_03419 [Trypanosoma rangeli]|eukprot:RNF07443.1 hypothetical protein TraAM80_03419 [Trypanosoma rangeli]
MRRRVVSADSKNPRGLKAAEMCLNLCVNCGDVFDASGICVRCGNTYREERATRACSFCEITYSQRAVSCVPYVIRQMQTRNHFFGVTMRVRGTITGRHRNATNAVPEGAELVALRHR